MIMMMMMMMVYFEVLHIASVVCVRAYSFVLTL